MQHAGRHNDTVFGWRGIKPELERARLQRIPVEQRVAVGRAVGLLIVA